MDLTPLILLKCMIPIYTKVENDDHIGSQNTDIMDCDEGRENLDLIVNIMEEQEMEEREKLIMTLGNAFVEDGQERTQQLDIQYLTGLKKFFIWTQSQTQNQQSLLHQNLHHCYTLILSKVLLSSSWYKTHACSANCHIKTTRRSHKRK